MTVELEEKIEVGTTELVTSDPLDDIPDMVAHLYRVADPTPRTAFCGLKNADPHAQMHRASGDKATPYKPGTSSCHLCGAPICVDCLAEKERRDQNDE